MPKVRIIELTTVSHPTLRLADNDKGTEKISIDGWRLYEHPQSKDFYYFDAKRRVTMVTNVGLPRVRDILNMGIENVLSQICKAISHQELPPGMELYIELAPGVINKPTVYYYVVDYFAQKVVWLSKPSSENFQMIDSRFWAHAQSYPTHLRADYSLVGNFVPLLYSINAKLTKEPNWHFAFDQAKYGKYLDDLRKLLLMYKSTPTTVQENYNIACVAVTVENYYKHTSTGHIPKYVVKLLGVKLDPGFASFWPVDNITSA